MLSLSHENTEGRARLIRRVPTLAHIGAGLISTHTTKDNITYVSADIFDTLPYEVRAAILRREADVYVRDLGVTIVT